MAYATLSTLKGEILVGILEGLRDGGDHMYSEAAMGVWGCHWGGTSSWYIDFILFFNSLLFDMYFLFFLFSFISSVDMFVRWILWLRVPTHTRGIFVIEITILGYCVVIITTLSFTCWICGTTASLYLEGHHLRPSFRFSSINIILLQCIFFIYIFYLEF